jgi:MoaA/NifB/PqqE/SkfB family radical SAM enzyme
MTGKFLRRTAAHVVSPRSPYFVHLAVTHRCNLRCRFCQIPAAPFEELDLDGMRRVIDRLDHLGVGVVALTGGEPLLRHDFAAIVNHAASRRLYVKVASNGTMPSAKYEELIASNVSEIGISLDGVRGDDLPRGHVSPRILESVRSLSDRLRHGQRLTLNITISDANCQDLPEIVEHCAREFPRAFLWLNPVVVGEGKLRVPGSSRVNPDFLQVLHGPTLSVPRFYRLACAEYYSSPVYDWHCLAGQAFFDVKPNGDLWLCQDQPTSERLNVLDPDFEHKFRKMDVSRRRQCPGCTYSCYLLSQKAFEVRNWPDMAGLWWCATTRPAEPCRRTARKYGAAAGLAHFVAARASASIMRKLSGPAGERPSAGAQAGPN